MSLGVGGEGVGGVTSREEGALSVVLGAGGVARWPEAGTGGLQVQLVLGLQLPSWAEEKGNPRQRERRSWGLEFERAGRCARSWAKM